jgi:hypothetical protein
LKTERFSSKFDEGLEVQDKEVGLEVQDKKEGLDVQTNKFVTKWLGTFCKIIMRPDLAYSSSDFHTSLALSQKKKIRKIIFQKRSWRTK